MDELRVAGRDFDRTAANWEPRWPRTPMVKLIRLAMADRPKHVVWRVGANERSSLNGSKH